MELPLGRPGRWVVDGRGEGRAVRVSAHAEAGFLVVSTWKAGTCVGTVRLLPAEAAELATGLVEGLAELARPVVPVLETVDGPDGSGPADRRPVGTGGARGPASDGGRQPGGAHQVGGTAVVATVSDSPLRRHLAGLRRHLLRLLEG